MDEKKPGRKVVKDLAAEGGDVMPAVERAVGLGRGDRRRERNLEEAEEIYDEAEGKDPKDSG